MTEWNQFRGDRRNSGRRPDLEGPERIETRWAADVSSAVATDPVCDRAAVYVGTDRGALYAFDRDEGHRRWVFEAFEAPPVTPVATRDGVFLAATDGAVAALDPTTGEERWRTILEDPLEDDAALAAADGALLVGTRGGLAALEAATGEERWSRATEGAVVGSPAVDDGRVYVGTTENVVHAYALEDGPLAGESSEDTETTPETASEATDDRDATTLDADAIEGADGVEGADEADSSETVWTAPISGTLVDGPTVADGRVYVADDAGTLFSLGGETGQTYFTYEMGGAFTSAPTVVDETAFVAGDDDYLHVVETTFGTRRLRGWLFSKKGVALDTAIRANPVVAGDLLCVSDANGTLYGIDADDPDFEWQFGLDRAAAATPAVGAGRLYVGCEDERLYCLAWERDGRSS